MSAFLQDIPLCSEAGYIPTLSLTHVQILPLVREKEKYIKHLIAPLLASIP